jgi:hypothetical protein
MPKRVLQLRFKIGLSSRLNPRDFIQSLELLCTL